MTTRKSNWKELIAWQKCHQLALDVSETISTMPNDERFGIKTRITKLLYEIPANLVRGKGYGGRTEMGNRIDKSCAAIEELRYLLLLSTELLLLSEDILADYEERLDNIGNILGNFSASQKGLRKPRKHNSESGTEQTPHGEGSEDFNY